MVFAGSVILPEVAGSSRKSWSSRNRVVFPLQGKANNITVHTICTVIEKNRIEYENKQ